MIGLSVVLLLMALDGHIGRIDGVLLVAGLIVYTVVTWLVLRGIKPTNTAGDRHPGVGTKGYFIRTLALDMAFTVAVLVAVLVSLVFGVQQTVAGATGIAEALQISSLIIGLTVVAAGTSLPELATSVLASFKGERDLAVGNVVGSNIFNILGIPGLATVVSWSGVPVDPSRWTLQ